MPEALDGSSGVEDIGHLVGVLAHAVECRLPELLGSQHLALPVLDQIGARRVRRRGFADVAGPGFRPG